MWPLVPELVTLKLQNFPKKNVKKQIFLFLFDVPSFLFVPLFQAQ